ncbi:MAG: YigZ family protein [Bacteroidota bacterium]|nr:YigZ family protein [Bacteroidota bacterium]
MFDDNYREIKSPATGLYKEKGSKFIAYAFPVYSEVQAKKKLENVKKLEHSARHHCYAYVLHADKSAWRANDDGEPSSTAGKPILGQIQSNNLTNILIIVVRYFGGVKLGVSGLIRSYRTAVANAISQATIITKSIKKQYEIYFKYPQINDVMRLIKELDLELIHTDFQIECKLIFAVEKSKSDNAINAFQKHHKLTIKPINPIK